MKIIRNFLILTVAVVAFSFSTPGAVPAPKLVDINEEKVGKEIRSMFYYGVFDLISYEIDGSTVILSGKVYNAPNRKSAERRVKKIKGVDNVVNNIEILPFSRFDNKIRRDLLRSFSRTNIYRYLQGVNPSMRIIVNRGHVTLEGYVRYESDSKLAKILASGIFGTFSVKNNLIVTKENLKL